MVKKPRSVLTLGGGRLATLSNRHPSPVKQLIIRGVFNASKAQSSRWKN
jgi:hypothetical protein